MSAVRKISESYYQAGRRLLEENADITDLWKSLLDAPDGPPEKSDSTPKKKQSGETSSSG
jgi:hypothetical protein